MDIAGSRAQRLSRRLTDASSIRSPSEVECGARFALIWVVSLPVQVAMTDPTPAGLGVLDWVGTAVWAVGLTFEAVGDWQLSRFKADPANRGKVMDRGL